jgi:DNA-binding NtrC family response regulator
MTRDEPIRILVVEDDATVRTYLGGLLSSRGWEVEEAETGEEGIAASRESEFDVVFLDLMLPGMSGLEVLRQLEKEGPPTPEIVIITGDPSIDSAVEAMRLGAFDYVEKPLQSKRILLVVEQAAARYRLERENRLLRRVIDHQRVHGPVISESPQMRSVLELVDRIACTDAPVLITGETGVGKGLVASRVHAASARAQQAFIHLNCGGLQEQLVESELFGHEKGSFTGAVATKPGLFEVAHGGTLFLDEVTELTQPMQANLLQVLDSGELRRVGGSTLRKVDARIVAATNRDIGAEVEASRFREDLFFRLNVVHVEIPPLRERRADIAGLARLYLARYGGPDRALSSGALERLESYDWPGNVRELSNVVQRALLLARTPELDADDLPLPQGPRKSAGRKDDGRPSSLKDVEKRHIAWTLRHTEGNRAAAARVLGIDVKTLRTKIRRYELGE